MKNKAPDAQAVEQALEKLYPAAVCSLDYGGDAWRLLVAARLSAQCTDERVNLVTPELFRRYPNAESMSASELCDVEKIIRPCGLFRAKAKSIVDMSKLICTRFGGKVPDTMDELLTLPGVGRKIANLVLGDIYGIGGIVADTHCIRICGRLGFCDSSKKDPLLTERTMEKLIPSERRSDFCHRLVLFGRETCTARAPQCDRCPLSELCDEFNQKQKSCKSK